MAQLTAKSNVTSGRDGDQCTSSNGRRPDLRKGPGNDHHVDVLTIWQTVKEKVTCFMGSVLPVQRMGGTDRRVPLP